MTKNHKDGSHSVHNRRLLPVPAENLIRPGTAGQPDLVRRVVSPNWNVVTGLTPGKSELALECALYASIMADFRTDEQVGQHKRWKGDAS
jgi:hypothetical protein